MIVWLASYPRSGNTLLRTVLHSTMGFPTYSDEVDPEVRRNVSLTDVVQKSFGRTELPVPWADFHPQATAARELFLVKTHRAPRDDQPAIYVVRDGRQASVSYEKFHAQFQPDRRRTLLELVLGHDFYGGWSEHFRSWTQRPRGRTIVVSFEELVAADEPLLARLAGFLGHGAPPAPWRNPFEQMNKDNPGFVREGAVAWRDVPTWTPFIDAIFFRLHGALMQELGYAGAADVERSRAGADAAALQLADIASSLAQEKRMLERVCEDRQAVIEGLNRACEERLALIERLSAR